MIKPNKLKRGAFLAAVTLAASALINDATAADVRRIAFSKSLGVDIFAQDAGAGWCGANLIVEVRATDPSVFNKPEFASLIKIVGEKVLPNECPVAAKLVITGVDVANKSVFQGSADKATGWDLAASALPSVIAAPAVTAIPASPNQATDLSEIPEVTAPVAAEVSAASRNSVAPKTEAPTPKQESPILGDWTGTYVCNSSYSVTLSVDEVNGKKFNGIVNFARDKQPGFHGRYEVTGFFDQQTRQLQVQHKSWIDRPRGHRALDLNGDLDLDAGTVSRRLNCYGPEAKMALSRTNTVPAVAKRIRAAQDLAEKRVIDELARPREGRLVGVAPKGEFRTPDCDGFIAWYRSQPAGLRMRIFGNDSTGILRLFDDQSSKAYFGTPFYFASERQLRGLGNELYKACRAMQRNNRSAYDEINKAVNDWQSISDLIKRRQLDETLVTFIPEFLGRAGPIDEQIDVLSKLETDTANALRNWGIDARYLTTADIQMVAEDAKRYRAIVSRDLIASALVELPRTPETIEGLSILHKRLSELKLQVGTGDADSLTNYESANMARQIAIANSLIDKAIEAIETLPHSLEGMSEADLVVSELESQLKELDVEARLTDLRKVANDFRNETSLAVIAAEIEDVAKSDVTPEAARQLRERSMKVIHLVKDGPELPSLETYKKTVNDRIQFIAVKNISSFEDELEELPNNWKGVEVALSMQANAQRNFEGAKAMGDYTAAAESRAAAIRKTLADQVIVDIKGRNDSYDDINRVAAIVEDRARLFESRGGASDGQRIREAGKRYIADVIESGFKQFKIDLAAKVDNEGMEGAILAAITALELAAREDAYPALKSYRQHAAKEARGLVSKTCDSALGESGIKRNDDLPVLVGDNILPLGSVACALGSTGHRITEFKSPGFFGDKVWKMRIFTKREEWINLEFEKKEVKPDVYALVAILKEQNGKRESLSMNEWKTFASLYFEPNLADLITPDKAVCRAKSSQKEEYDIEIKRVMTCP